MRTQAEWVAIRDAQRDARLASCADCRQARYRCCKAHRRPTHAVRMAGGCDRRIGDCALCHEPVAMVLALHGKPHRYLCGHHHAEWPVDAGDPTGEWQSVSPDDIAPELGAS